LIASTRSCGPEVIQDEVTGLLADPDRPAEIADKVLHLIRHRSAAVSLGAAAREKAVKEFSVQVVTDRTLRFYTS